MKPRLASFARKRNYAPAVLSELCRPVVRAYARARAPEPSAPLSAARRLLLMGDNHLGDILVRTPSLPALRAGFPEAEISCLTCPAAAELLRGNPCLDRILPLMETDDPLAMADAATAVLAQARFDAALITSPVRYWPHLILAVRLGIPHRVCYAHKGLSGLVTRPVPYAECKPHAAAFRDWVVALTGREPDWDLRPRLFLEEADTAEAERVWKALAPNRATPAVAFFCTTRQPQRVQVWPDAKWAECARILRQRTGADILLAGAPEDRDRLHAIASLCTVPVRVLAGELPVRGVAAFIAKCAAILTTDSGPRHLGNAAGTPVVFLRNLAVFRREADPYCDNETDVAPAGECLSPAQQRRILAGIDAERVAETVISRMRRTGDRQAGGPTE